MFLERQPGPLDYFLLLALSFLWGSAFLLTEVALTGFGPVTIAAGRISLGALALILFCAATARIRRPSRRDLIYLALGGISGTAFPFAVIAWGQQETTSATAAILIAFTPIATMLLAQVMTHDERLTPHRLLGAAVALTGVAVLVGWGGSGAPPLRMLAVLAGATGYGLSGMFLRRVEHLPAAMSAAACLSLSALMIVPAALASGGPQAPPDGPALAALAALGLLPTALATILMVTLLKRTSATFVSFNNFLIPVVGTVLGLVFLGEAFTANQAAGLALILSGLALARRRKRRQDRACLDFSDIDAKR